MGHRRLSGKTSSSEPGSQQPHRGNIHFLRWAELKKRRCHPHPTRHGLQLHMFIQSYSWSGRVPSSTSTIYQHPPALFHVPDCYQTTHGLFFMWWSA